MKQLLLYLPVVHAGYEAVLDRHADADEILLLGTSFGEDYPELRKDIRALAPGVAAHYLRSARDARVTVIERDDLPAAVVADVLVVPDEAIMRDLMSRYALEGGREIVVEPTFLRWDRAWSQAGRPAGYDGVVGTDELARSMLGRAAEAAGWSSDWWRRVGAIAITHSGEILGPEHNQHLPSEYTPYIDGDPRNEFHRGVRADLSLAIHAEAALVAHAARTGTSLEGADLFVTTFPCPACARLVAEAGFRRCYFAGPYATLDGDTILRAAGVELIWVDTGTESLPGPGA